MKLTLKKILKRLYIILILMILLYGLITIVDKRISFADSGFDTGYDSGGGDFGGGGSGGGFSDGGSSSDYDGSGSADLCSAIITISLILGLGLIFEIRNRRKEKVDERKIENIIKKSIPDFNKERFFSECEKIYRSTQTAIMKSDLDSIKEIVDDNMYTKLESKLVVYESNDNKYNLNNFTILQSCLHEATVQSNMLIVSVSFKVKSDVKETNSIEKYMLDYSMDLKNPNKKWILTEFCMI